MKILITGFDLFRGKFINLSEEDFKRIKDKINGVEIIKLTMIKSVEAIEQAVVKHMNENSVLASLSNITGTFVFNHVMYGLLYLIDKKYPNIKVVGREIC